MVSASSRSCRHPSGFFVRGDPSLLPGIVRKTRNRPSKRRASASSAVSNERSDGSTPPPPIPQWAPPTEYQPQYTDEHNSSLHSYGVVPTFNPSLDSLRTIGDQQAAASAASSVPPITSGTNDTWRAYTPPTWNFSGTSGNLPQQPPGRRTSVSDFKISAPISPRSTNKTELPSPRLRKVPSSISIQNTSSPNYQHQQHEEPLYSPASHRSTPYPTPTFNTYPLPSGLAAPYDPPSIYDSSTSVPPPFGPYNHYSYHSAQATNPLPSPTYSSDGDHNPHHTLQQQHLDPRSLLTAPNSGRSSFSGPSGSATQLGGGAGGGEGGLHYFGQRVPQPPPPPPQSGANLVWSATPRGLMGGSNNYHEQAR